MFSEYSDQEPAQPHHVPMQTGNLSEKEQYMDMYGVTLNIPAMYILDAKFYPGSMNKPYIIRIVKFVKPEV
jgi:hypothetical protein